ncbi:MAG: PQQ-binding-like beta-propeller repeat protein [Armatimonadota bacterium]|nr:PQQ-binding-like beta-propeller repeat protein [Armatimonadota bacterium]
MTDRARVADPALRRLGVLLLVVVGCVLAAAQVGAQAPAPAAALWWLGGGNLQRLNFTPKPGGLTAPHVAWRLPFETTASPASVSPPAAADLDGDGRVELVYGEGVRIVALEPPFPRRRWDFSVYDIRGLILMQPAVLDVDGDRRPEVFFAPYQAGGNSTFFRLNSRGQAVWTFPVRAYTSYASPAVADLDGTGRYSVIFADTQGTVYALDAATGRPRWTFPMGGSADMNAAAVVDLDRDGKREIVLGNHGNGQITALDGEGRLRWVYNTGGSIYGVSVDDADGNGEVEIYAADWNGAVHSLTPQGRLRWTYRTPGPVTAYNGLAVADLDRDGTKEVVFGVQNGWVIALSPAGRVVWQFQRRGHISGSVIVADFDRDGQLEVFAGSHSGAVYLLAGRTGAPKWEQQPGGRMAYMGITAEDIDGDGLVEVLINNDEHLYAFSRPPAR